MLFLFGGIVERLRHLEAQDVEYYLAALDLALIEQGIEAKIPVLLLGGAYIMISVNIRRMTNDIDIFPFVGGDLDQATGIPLAAALYLAAQTVAGYYQLDQFWLNTIRSGALLPEGLEPPRSLWKKHQVLEVYLPEPEYVLIQKLLIHRRKDQQDIVALFQVLGITKCSQAQALFDRYISPEEQRRRKLPLLLLAYLPEGEERRSDHANVST